MSSAGSSHHEELRGAIEAVVKNFARQQPYAKVDVCSALEEFWGLKSPGIGIRYEEIPPPHVSFVTLPGGACFGSFKVCGTVAESRRSAAKIALMNSLFNEHPSRVISEAFVAEEVARSREHLDLDDPALEAFHQILNLNKGKTMLQYAEMMTVFQLLHWNGSLRAMRKRGCSKSEVIEHYSNRRLDDEIRHQMSLDCAAREKCCPGIIAKELEKAETELLDLRNLGRELSFPKEKRAILLSAINLV